MFGVDDGAKDEDEMLAILDAAYQSGTRLLCCTPHFHPGYWGHNRERSAAAYDRLTAAARDRYPDLRLHLGNELRYSPGCVSWLREGDCRALGQTRCVLADFSSDAPARLIESGLGSLLNAGYTPVLAHAERYEAQHKNLELMFAGKYPPNPVELLGGKSFDKLLGAVRESYDYVLIDLPPLGSVIDAAVVAAKCDGAILVISDHQVRCHQAVEVVDQLKKCGSRILGVVRNNIHASSSGYYKKYYKDRYQ